MAVDSRELQQGMSPAPRRDCASFPRHLVDAELARAMGSRAFAGSRRQQRFLHYLVHHVLAGNAAILKETVVAVEVFERCAHRFDPRLDSIVRVEARRLRQRLERFYEEEGAEARLRIELRAGSYVPQLRWVEPAPTAAATREARDLVERGEHFLRQGEEAALRKALDRFEAAARAAPGYASAHKGLAQARMALVCAWHEPPVPWVDEAMASLQRAMALDPGDATTLMLIGIIEHRHGHDWQRAEPRLRRAVEMAPQSAVVRCGYGFYLTLAGCAEAAEEQLHLARQLDPHYLNARLFMIKLRVAQRRWDDAEKELEALLDIAPQHFSARQTQADVCRCRGQADEAMALYRALQSEFPQHAMGLVGQAQVFAMRGEDAACKQALHAARCLMGRRIPPYSLAVVQMLAGRHDKALALLGEGAARRDPAFIFATIEPAFDGLRGHPRFIELLRRVRA